MGAALLEVAGEEAFEALAVAGFVLGHLVDGVVDGVVAEFLGQLGELELAGGGAVFGGDAHGQVRLGAGGEEFAEEFAELGGVLGFFPGVALEGFGDFGIVLGLDE